MKTFIITAGGIGKRMNSSIPKQFLKLNNKPILMHTILRFFDFDKNAQIILTLPDEWSDYWKQLCNENNFTVKHEIVNGGKERFYSIKNALNHAKGDIVCVHDGVRPLVNKKTIENCIKNLSKANGVIPVLPLKESLRKGSLEMSESLNRKEYFTVQTPQCFKVEFLKKAYDVDYTELFTDDASVFENSGEQVYLIHGNEENIKITSPVDLKIAEVLLERL